MGKFLGFCFFVAGLVAVYFLGVRPLLTQSSSGNTVAITVTARGGATPVVFTTDQRQAASAASRFLADWGSAHYAAMYAALTPQAQERIDRASFIKRYQGIMAEATASRVRASVSHVRLNSPVATVDFDISLSTAALGVIRQSNRMRMVYSGSAWRVDWYPAVIFKGLDDPYVVHLQTLPARRGAILDRSGTPLAEDGQFYDVGVVPGQISDERQLLSYMSRWLKMSQATIKHLYTLPWAQPTYFMPITTITSAQLDAAPPGLNALASNGLVWRPNPMAGRVYPQGAVAGILVGYVDPTTRHGVAGLEQSLDPVLSGKDGVALLITNTLHNMTVSTIARRAPVDGRDVRLTIDLATQRAAEHALGIRKGAAVAIDPRNGQVLAMASTPGYDPNRFEIGATQAAGIGPIRSTFPRATLGTYPIGSIFKIVTMAAALEHGGYTPETLIDGPGVWYGLGQNYPLHDWLPSGHGTISLREALVQSCDTCFYQVAQKLDGIDQNMLPREARAFGFGRATGIPDIADAAGLVGDNTYKEHTYHDAWRTGDTVNLSIGQGYFLATPLQTASMLAAVANGGARLTPQVILSIGPGKPHGYAPKPTGTLPLTPAHLQAIVQGMLGVTSEVNGTATFVFRNFPWQVAGKTGTAQNPGGAAHAWFGCFAPAGKPAIALAVVVENGGEGSMVAAPIARKILQSYLPRAVSASASGGPQQLTVPGG